MVPCLAQAADYTTYHYDNARDGWNDRETVLTQANAAKVKQSGDYVLDGEVDAQPLYYKGIAYVVTQNDTLYAISPGRGVLWTRSFGTPVASDAVGCQATAPTIGIAATPVIDPATDTLYLVAYVSVRGAPHYVLHAVSTATGRERGSADITAAAGNPYTEHQRAGLLLSSDRVYVAFAGFCDRHADTTFGRILAYNAATLAPGRSFVTTASPRCNAYHFGTIWGLGFAPAADAQGDVYVSTGNGCIDYTRPPRGAYSDAVLRLTPRLRLTDLTTALFAPCTALRDDEHDQEIGSGGVLLAPGMPYAIAGGKTGMTYVLDQSNLGGYHTTCPDSIVYETQTTSGVWGGPVAWRSGNSTYFAIAGNGLHGIRSYRLERNGRLVLQSQTGIALERGGQSATVTSNGSHDPASVVLWTLTRPETGAISLQAYDPMHLDHALLNVPAGSWSNPIGYAPCTPTVADGRVFVATDRRLTIWSLVSPRAVSRGASQLQVRFALASTSSG